MSSPTFPSRANRGLAAVIFDMDGVVTNTARIHAAAWKALFDEALATVAPDQAPFDEVEDYRAHVDARRREDGVRSFLSARGIAVPEGHPDDPEEEFTVHGLSRRKQRFFDEALRREKVEVFPDALTLLRRLRTAEIPIALATSSRNSGPVLENAGITDMFDLCVDGNDALELGLPGKPAPDLFLEAARRLDVPPTRCAVLEDARAGVEAAHAGAFGLVIGVDRGDDSGELWEAGADRVLRDVGELDFHAGWQLGKQERPSPWILSYDHYDPAQEGFRETLCTTGNGYWATRGAVPGVRANDTHYPGVYLAGVFNRVETDFSGRPVETEHLVNAPDWACVRVETEEGRLLHPSADEILDFRQELDIHQGILRRMVRQRDAEGRITRISTEQFQSMADTHMAALQMTIEPENWEGTLWVYSAINGDVRNKNVAEDAALDSRHLRPPVRHHVDERTVLLETRTKQSSVNIAMGTRTTLQGPGTRPVVARPADTPRSVGQRYRGDAMPGWPLSVEKIAAASTERDRALSTPVIDVSKRIQRARSYRDLKAAHVAEWERLWQLFHVDIENGRKESLALNLHTFHVLQSVAAANPDLDAGVPARGLHGEGYRGHLFWDELFIYPMLTLRQPALTRSLLLYRYRRLDEARAAAQQAGLRGALFPWQSGSEGREETPAQLYNPISDEWMPDNSHNQHHVGLAIAYSVWQYHEATDDKAFLTDVGAELLLEVARLFASNVEHSPQEDRYSISGVMGPDEFHDGYPDAPGEGLRDNAYTNVLASWTLAKAPEVLDALDPHDAASLRERLGLTDEELGRWDHISRRLRVPFHADGVISQFEGYEDLAEFDWEGYRRRYNDIGRLDLILAAEGDSPNNYRLAKQADTLMLFYLFSGDELMEIFARMGYELTTEMIRDTVDFYVERTSDGSSLSKLVHGWVLARKDREQSWSLFQQALETDLINTASSSTREGIHAGAMAGTVDMVLRCYGGVETRQGKLVLHPLLPDELPALSFQLHYRGQPIDVRITQDRVRLQLHPSSARPVEARVEDIERTLHPGEEWEVSLANAVRQPVG